MTIKMDKSAKFIYNYHELLAKIYHSQVLGHVCLESFEEYNKLSVRQKLMLKNELKLFYLKRPEYIEALRLIEKRIAKDIVIEKTNISERCYYRLLNIPIVRKYVYFEDLDLKLFNAKQTAIIDVDPFNESQISNHTENYEFQASNHIENYYFQGNSQS